MRLKEGIDLVAFFRRVKECKGDVFLETEEGDQLNLKSALSQYVFVVLTEQREILTDACKICLLQGEEVHLVRGEVFNIKITYPYDLRVAESLIDNNILED